MFYQNNYDDQGDVIDDDILIDGDDNDWEEDGEDEDDNNNTDNNDDGDTDDDCAYDVTRKTKGIGRVIASIDVEDDDVSVAIDSFFDIVDSVHYSL